MSTHNLHGDIGLHPLDADPKTFLTPSQRVKYVKGVKRFVIASSDMTGNSHVLISDKSNLFVWHTQDFSPLLDGSTWRKDTLQVVYCPTNYVIVHEGPNSEHGTQEVEAGLREIRREQEYEVLQEVLRNVID